MSDSDKREKRDNERLLKIANKTKILRLLDKYGTELERLKDILHLLQASGFGESSWSIIENPKRLEEYLKMEAAGVEFPEILSKLMKYLPRHGSWFTR